MPSHAVSVDSFTTFGDLLRYLRLRAQLTQQELAIAVGYSEAQISRLERNHRPPEGARLVALFVPALHLEDEPKIVNRLLHLAAQASAEQMSAEQTAARDQPGRTEPQVKPGPLSWQVAPRTNLPAMLTSFIGREQELTAVCQCVLDHRLVTVTGAGGVGKTRLALRAAEELLEYFPQGVWLVELAPLADPALVQRIVAGRLGVRELPGQDLLQALEGFLKIGSLLLVLDNCEHVIGEVASLVFQLLRDCPELHILATSREILRVEGEAPFRCPSLTLPPLMAAALEMAQPGARRSADYRIVNAQQPDLAKLAQSEAVRLFIERTCSIWPETILSQANAGPVAQICRQLDGIPLAIELAAARTRMLSVEQIAARLDHAFGLLTGGSRTELPRHQTLRALVDWSYNLLSPEERILLNRLSVFAGGWTLEATEAVCADPEVLSGQALLPDERILDLLGELVDKSLIQFDPAPNEEPRYRMLETVRQYARERLAESDGEKALRERHLDYFLSLALRAEPRLRAPGAKNWLDRLERELDNLRLALEWSLSDQGQQLSSRIQKGLRLAASLHWLWWGRGHSMEGAEWLERLLREQTIQSDRQRRTRRPPETESLPETREQAGTGSLDPSNQAARGRALNVLGWIIFYNSETFPVRLLQIRKALGQESQAIFQSLIDGLSDESGRLFRHELALSRLIATETVNDVLACREQFRRLNELFWVAECDAYLADFFLHKDNSPKNYERAEDCAEESLVLHREMGDLEGEGDASFTLSNFALLGCDYERAIQLGLAGLDCLEAAGNRERAAVARTAYIMHLVEGGDHQEAMRQLEQVGRVAFEFNNRFLYLEHQKFWAFLAWDMGEYELAAQYCREVLEFRESLPVIPLMRAIYFFIRVCLSQGNIAQVKDSLKDFFKQVTQPWQIFKAIQVAGILAAQGGQMQRAATLFGAQDLLWEQGGRCWYRLTPRERSENEPAQAAARAALGEEGFGAAWEAGRAMTIEQMIQLAQESIN